MLVMDCAQLLQFMNCMAEFGGARRLFRQTDMGCIVLWHVAHRICMQLCFGLWQAGQIQCSTYMSKCVWQLGSAWLSTYMTVLSQTGLQCTKAYSRSQAGGHSTTQCEHMLSLVKAPLCAGYGA
jgi:hypothetical protein